MKRNMRMGLLAVVLAGGGVMLAWPGTTATVQADEHADHETIEHAMETLNQNYRTIRRSARDASKNGETADLLAEMITAAVEAKGALPGVVHKAQGDSKSELTATYRKSMNELIVVLAQAENAALEGRNDELLELVAKANEIKAAGHEVFIPEDE